MSCHQKAIRTCAKVVFKAAGGPASSTTSGVRCVKNGHSQVPLQCGRRHTQPGQVQEEQALQHLVLDVCDAMVHKPFLDLQSRTHGLRIAWQPALLALQHDMRTCKAKAMANVKIWMCPLQLASECLRMA